MGKREILNWKLSEFWEREKKKPMGVFVSKISRFETRKGSKDDDDLQANFKQIALILSPKNQVWKAPFNTGEMRSNQVF